ncbi:MAG TPA: endonuclease III [Thermoanaerobaculia bacterium]|nr:endonuclease III [Thermoanaerobaculia bacterium]
MAAPRLKRGGPPRRRESARARRERTATILDRLAREYPDATCALTHANPFQLLVATILSAQCTDEQVNRVTPALFARFPDAAALAGADLAEVEALVHSTGFFRNKARALVGLGQALVADHDGQVPATMAELVRLPGVGRKTANVFGRDEGIVVDTHVARLSRRLGLAAGDSPEAIERELMALVPRDAWTLWAHLLIFHGRQVCPARRPRCASCVVADLCPSAEL